MLESAATPPLQWCRGPRRAQRGLPVMVNDTSAAEFPSHWRDALTEMQREWDRLHQEIAQLRSERDQLSKALLVLLHDDFDFTLSEEEILAQIGREKPLREFLLEMRAQLVEG